MPLSSSAPSRAGDIDAAAALGELARRDGRMAELCTENGSLRMDWVDSVETLLADDGPLLELEEHAERWRRRGVRHVIWSGMGGSGVTVGVLAELLGPSGDGPAIHLLDSTDPAALDALVAKLGEGPLRDLLQDVVLVAVSMGITSEEPASHLAWFLDLLATAGLPPDRHVLVLTVPGSRVEEAAALHGVEARPVFLGGRGGLPGRMSAPGTAVFLLPVALALGGGDRRLRHVLADAWSAHDRTERSPYVQLAAEIAAGSRDGCCRLMLELKPEWAALHGWIEQLFEQTLGKDGRGVVVFTPQPCRDDDDLVRAAAPAPDPSLEPHAALAAAMLGWQLTVALLGRHAGTNIVDEPAVEDYKARARALRSEADPLAIALGEGALDWAAQGPAGLEPAAGGLSYLDVTINGELDPTTRLNAETRLRRLGNDLLVPVKLRRAPAAYHVSEQCQLDGPPGIVSLRLVARTTPPAAIGSYTPQFLQAQAVATWQAMTARGRACTLVVVDRLEDVTDVLAALEERVA